MTEKIKEIKHLQQDGTFKTYPIGADASNIDLQNGKTLEAALRENYVQRTDYATNLKGGVIKTSSAYGTQTGSGLLSGVTYSYDDYQNKSHQNGFISKGTLENVIAGKGLVSNTDYATSNKGGVVKVTTGAGFNIVNGDLKGYAHSYNTYQAAGNDFNIAKGTLESVITGKELVNKTYVDTIVGDIGTVIDEINGEVIGG